MEDATLDRLESIIDMRNGPLEDHVARVIEEPVGIHALERLRWGLVWHGVNVFFFFLFFFLFRRIAFSVFSNSEISSLKFTVRIVRLDEAYKHSDNGGETLFLFSKFFL